MTSHLAARDSSQIPEGLLCPAPTAPNPRWFTGRSKPEQTFTKAGDAAVQGRNQVLISVGKWPRHTSFYSQCLTHCSLQSLLCGFISRQLRCLFSLLLAIPFMEFLINFMDKNNIGLWLQIWNQFGVESQQELSGPVIWKCLIWWYGLLCLPLLQDLSVLLAAQ